MFFTRNIEFIPDDLPDNETRVKQYVANLTDKDPEFAKEINGKTWPEIFKRVGFRRTRF